MSISEGSESISEYLQPGPYQDVPALLGVFKFLDQRLAEENMPHMSAFNDVYGRVTEKVYQYTQKSFFDNPGLVLKNMTKFGSYYTDPLLEFSRGNHDRVAKIWVPSLYHPKKLVLPPAMQLACDVNSHVSYDLGVSVEKTGFREDYEADFANVDHPILETIEEVIDQYVIVSAKSRPWLVHGVAEGVSRMRGQAWQIAKNLNEAGNDKRARDKIERQAARVTMRRHKMILHGGAAALNAIQVPDRFLRKISLFGARC